ncbi:response regulator transcription factor [Shewanella sp. GXUN23E]|uniref:response regulator transcription factor n=1 Tax=Shewanella sp. GXUN23E TaxID=3422498 RepID=UPI003D7E0DF3
MAIKLLLVEDDARLSQVLINMLNRANYEVDLVSSLIDAKFAVVDTDYDLVLLDRLLTDGDGIDLVLYSNEHHLQIRFLILSALSDVANKVKGLEYGAHDYISKPFEPDELLARIKVQLRSSLKSEEHCLSAGSLTLNSTTLELTKDSTVIDLPRRELQLLDILLRNKGFVVTRSRLEEAMYGVNEEILSNSLESHISKLRKNISTLESSISIVTVRGIGYRMIINEN